MNFVKKIDNYLLHHYPNIWITKIHWVLPIGLTIIGLIFLFNVVLFSYDRLDPIPETSPMIIFLVILVIIGLVYWFVLQARHNVEKSGGRLSLLEEFINYFSYLLVFLVAWSIITAVPFTNEYKVDYAIDDTEFLADIDHINLGNAVVNHKSSLTKDGDVYEFERVNFIDPANNNRHQYSRGKKITVNHVELVQIIENYLESYNKFSEHDILDNPETIIARRVGIDYGIESDYYDYYYNTESNRYYSYSPPISKMRRLNWLVIEKDRRLLKDRDFLFSMFSICGVLALFVWIFKQVHWKYYVYGLIALAVVPIVVGFLSFVFYEVSDIRPDDFVFGLMIFGYLVTSIVIFAVFFSDTLNHTSIVVAMFLQLYIPFLPIVLVSNYDRNHVFHFTQEAENNIFYISWILGLLSIILFKQFYQKMRSLPAKK